MKKQFKQAFTMITDILNIYKTSTVVTSTSSGLLQIWFATNNKYFLKFIICIVWLIDFNLFFIDKFTKLNLLYKIKDKLNIINLVQ